MEIANELIPHVMKAEAASSNPSENSVLNDPYCFGQLIRFYDGICCWEEGSPTPVLHIGWAKPMVASFSKFDAGVRNQLKFSGPPKSEDGDNQEEEPDEGKSSSPSFCNLNSHENILSVDTDASFHSTSSDEGICLLTPNSNENNKDDNIDFSCAGNDSTVPENIQTKSNIKHDENSEIAINNNYYDIYSSTKSNSVVSCDSKLSMSLKSSFHSSYQSVKNKIGSTTTTSVINNDDNIMSKNVLPSDEKYVCDNHDHVQSRSLNSNHKKRKYFDNSTYSQEYYDRSVQKKIQI